MIIKNGLNYTRGIVRASSSNTCTSRVAHRHPSLDSRLHTFIQISSNRTEMPMNSTAENSKNQNRIDIIAEYEHEHITQHSVVDLSCRANEFSLTFLSSVFVIVLSFDIVIGIVINIIAVSFCRQHCQRCDSCPCSVLGNGYVADRFLLEIEFRWDFISFTIDCPFNYGARKIHFEITAVINHWNDHQIIAFAIEQLSLLYDFVMFSIRYFQRFVV